ncbi:MAG: aminopeptidase P family protein [Lachnospiraceae bacterium]|nr:aminopeptidase P family protein [Lachnospiraceae bacterium]MBQ5599736.1 aminopeptidase P family protein [Lachnospiraceae bacterium]MBQ5699618.1 aminopeptidase P family protein [Lachnospiraceae bacterium]MBR0305193.1 aminopeptidase P family protein [Lachnospiraceae bacterium]
MANVRLEKLRALMEAHNMDAYYVPSSDFHDSEYVEDFFRCRAYVSGFTGSAGTLVVTKDFAGVWTDGRYFVQAKKELEGQDVELMKMGEEGVPTIDAFLAEKLPEGGVLGMDGRVVNTGIGRGFEKIVAKKNGSMAIRHDLVGEVWETRPELEAPVVWVLKEEFSGESTQSKVARLRAEMEEKGADLHVISTLDDIAWLLNIRKETTDGNVLPTAHVLVAKDSLRLFINSSRCSDEVMAYFAENNIQVEKYEDIYEAVAAVKEQKILLEPDKVNYALSSSIDASNVVIEAMNPTSLMKAVKNPVEVENLRKCHIKDGVALTKFIYWIKQNVGKIELSETEAAEKLEEFRKAQEGYLGPSFSTISAYGANAAMCHYHATKENESMVEANGFYLVDSGGQYYDGTTDVTRTIVVGPATEEMKKHFTWVLMGTLRLANAKFLHGCRGMNLDYQARGALWQQGLDFNHGTGHGVGFLSSVHERPNGIRWKIVPERMDSCILDEGMFQSDEPGLYIEGSHGIRTENLLICHKAEKNMYGQFMNFETLTFTPIDLDGVDISVMEPSDVRMLNAYHKECYEKLSPYMTEEENEWLKEATRAIGEGYTWTI